VNNPLSNREDKLFQQPPSKHLQPCSLEREIAAMLMEIYASDDIAAAPEQASLGEVHGIYRVWAAFRELVGRITDMSLLTVIRSVAKPTHDVVRTWVRGFAKTMALAPEAWSSIAEDERLQQIYDPPSQQNRAQ
jgi:hypothetical protein